MSKTPVILIAPLDWGIGHATRIIPIINTLLANNCKVIIAADGQAASLLKQEFPEIEIIFLKGYKVRYSKHKKYLPVKILLQTPGILLSIYKEHLWLKKVVKKYLITAVISDNRFGLFHNQIPCVYITHQLQIKTGNRISESFLQKMHNWFIKKYTECWVPDFEGVLNIAGQLSHPKSNVPVTVKYIGGLSRFQKHTLVQPKYDVLILLSGPEPQRTIFEKLILHQSNNFSGQILLIRGLPELSESLDFSFKAKGNILVKNHLTAQELNKAIEQSDIVICRSGYTTIMDLIKLQKTAILVPTPGQTEQEYLANHLKNQKLFYSEKQQKFKLSTTIKKATGYNCSKTIFNMEMYQEGVILFIESLHKQV